jgi:hypothetical protein
MQALYLASKNEELNGYTDGNEDTEVRIIHNKDEIQNLKFGLH